jgi:hypothetical protein
MNTSGIQSIAVKVSGSNSALLDDADGLQKLMRDIAEAASLHPLESVTHKFSPQGVSSALLLSESHIAVHTWPESGTAYISMTTCKPLNDVTIQQIQELVGQELAAEDITMKKVDL